MARRRKKKQDGRARLLDGWSPPENAGDPVGCLATSFTFDSAFFEDECLGRFLHVECDAQEDGPAYLVELEEKLAQITCATALVDQHHARGSRNLRWDLLPARPRRGILHAKVSLLHWARVTRIIIASANLTVPGYRRNHEVFGVLDYREGGDAPLACLRDVLEFLEQTMRDCVASSEAESPAAKRAQDLIRRVRQDSSTRGVETEGRPDGTVFVQPVFVSPGRPPATETLSELSRGGPPDQAWVISPFFDDGDPNRPAEAMWSVLRRRGSAELVFRAVLEEVPGTEELLIHVPEALDRATPRGRQDVATRFERVELEEDRSLHAKAIWLQSSTWAHYLVGSSNFTSAGLGLSVHPNIEANLLYAVHRQRNPKGFGRLTASFLPGEKIDRDRNLRWRPAQDDDADAAGDEVTLPAAFGAAVFEVDERQGRRIVLHFDGEPPAGWSASVEEEETTFVDDAAWKAAGGPERIVVEWTRGRPPTGFSVSRPGVPARAWWPVEVESGAALPPPEELRDLPLEVLIQILTSARPLHAAMRRFLRRRASGTDAVDRVVDPHAKVDTSGFLLQRTRRVSWALRGLRERLERPAATVESLAWRLRGPVGVLAVARAIAREARSADERAFLLTELALEHERVEHARWK